jgi:hypothetical protein
VRPRLTILAALAAAIALTAITVGAAPAGAAPATSTPVGKASVPPAASPPLPSPASEGLAVESGGIQVGPPLPSPGPPAKGGGVGAGKASHPGFFDIPGQIENAINEWFAGLVKDALDPAMVLVGRTLLSTPQIAGEAEVRSYWQLSVGVADSLLVLVVVAAGALVMSHETLQSSYALKDILPRLLIAGIASNASLAIAGQMVNIANVLSTALLGNGVEPQQAGHMLELLVLHAIQDGGIFLILLGLACAVLAVALLILYLVRASVIVLLVCAAPLLLLAHGLPQTEGLARLWWRAMFAVLGVQVAQALTLAAAVHVFFASGHSVLGLGTGGSLIDLLLVLCLFWVLLRIPFWAKEMVLSRRYGSTTARMAKTYVLVRVVKGALGGVL